MGAQQRLSTAMKWAGKLGHLPGCKRKREAKVLSRQTVEEKEVLTMSSDPGVGIEHEYKAQERREAGHKEVHKYRNRSHSDRKR